MPNWCEGTLKVRGTKKNLTEFVLKGLKPVDFLGGMKELLKFDKYGDVSSKETCWVEGTRRGFIEGLDVYFSEFEDEGNEIICLDYKQAWGIDTEQLLDICKKYNLDMKIYAFEMGMEFNQDIEIVNGEIIKDNEIKFDDYGWECVCPRLGG